MTLRRPDAKFYQLCTNHYVERAAPKSCRRYETLDTRLARLAEEGQAVDQPAAWAMLRSVAQPAGRGSSLLTYHSVVFEPNARRLHVAFCGSAGSAPANQPVTLRLDDLLERNRFRAPVP